MKSSKKLMAVLLTALLAASGFSSCGNTSGKTSHETSPPSSSTSVVEDNNTDTNSSKVNKTGLPIVDEKITLTGLVALFTPVGVPDWNEHPAILELENRTNIHIEWECVSQDGFAEKRNLIFASNTLPDMVMRAGLTAEQEVKYASSKQIIALDPYFEDYAPNFSALMETDNSIYKNTASSDGHIYAMPQLNTTEGSLIAKNWINQTWLDNLGLSMPETTDGLYDVLKAFKEQDANGNGDPNDEIPFSDYKTYPSDLAKTFYGAWGFGSNHGIIDRYLDIDDNGKIRLIAQEQGYKEILTYLNRLWEEDILDHEIFSQKQPQVIAKITEDTVGYTASGNNNQWLGERRNEFTAAASLTGPYGDNAWVQVSPIVQTTGTFVITSANPYPEATMRWVDYLYSEEGTVLVRLGIEGKSYTVNNGKYELLPEIKNDPNGLTLDEAIGKWSLYCGGSVPQYAIDKVDQSAAQLPEIKAATELLRPHLVPYDSIPKLKYTEQETISLGRFAEDIRTYIDECSVKFITGERSLDEFDSFVAELQGMNLEEYLNIQQTSFDRWNSN